MIGLLEAKRFIASGKSEKLSEFHLMACTQEGVAPRYNSAGCGGGDPFTAGYYSIHYGAMPLSEFDGKSEWPTTAAEYEKVCVKHPKLVLNDVNKETTPVNVTAHDSTPQCIVQWLAQRIANSHTHVT